MIYFDNAATSWPKPLEVSEAIVYFLDKIGANPGRAGHRLALDSGRLVYNARQAVSKLFNVSDPLRVVFTHNVTESLNLALYGLLSPGDHVITSSMEHNAMMRPLRALEKEGISITVVKCSPEGFLNPVDIEAAIQANTVLIALNHASNVVGTLLPVTKIGQITRKHDLLFLLDAAQTAGAYPIDMQANNIDLFGFTGHKALYGPTGTGGLIIGDRVDLKKLKPLKRGGTGSHSEHEQQPDFLPDMYESGTLNTVGLVGLLASINWLLKRGIETIRAHEIILTEQLIVGLKTISRLIVYGGLDATRQTATVSFNIDGMEPSEVGLRLDEEFNIMCRVGLHCSPAAHKSINTFPTGTVRFGLGIFNTLDEVNTALNAVEQIAQEM